MLRNGKALRFRSPPKTVIQVKTVDVDVRFEGHTATLKAEAANLAAPAPAAEATGDVALTVAGERMRSTPRKLQSETEVWTRVWTRRSFAARLTDVTRATMRNRLGCAGRVGP